MKTARGSHCQPASRFGKQCVLGETGRIASHAHHACMRSYVCAGMDGRAREAHAAWWERRGRACGDIISAMEFQQRGS
jgi:hypothetical protein